MPHWNDLTDAEKRAIIDAVAHDENWDGKIAIDVYEAVRRVMDARR
jgi:hypothetical protein